MSNQASLMHALLREEGREAEWPSIREQVAAGNFENLRGLPKALHMVFQRANFYERIYGLPLEDLVQEGIVACLEAKLTYDPHKSSLVTWQWWQIERRLKRYCHNTKRVVYTNELQEQAAPDVLEFHELMDGAPPDVLQVCALVLERPEQYGNISPSQCWNDLCEVVVDKLDWSLERAREAIADAKAWFRDTSAPLRRTN